MRVRGRLCVVTVDRFDGDGKVVDAKHNQPTSRAARDLRWFLMIVALRWCGDVHLGCALSCLPSSCE